MRLDTTNFFNQYMFHPFTNDLESWGQKTANFFLSLAALLFTAGILHASFYFIASKTTNNEAQDGKVQDIAQQNFEHMASASAPDLMDIEDASAPDEDEMDIDDTMDLDPQAQKGENIQDNPYKGSVLGPDVVILQDQSCCPPGGVPIEYLTEEQTKSITSIEELHQGLKHDAPLLDPKIFGLTVKEGSSQEAFDDNMHTIVEKTKARARGTIGTGNRRNIDYSKATREDCRAIQPEYLRLYESDYAKDQKLGLCDILAMPCRLDFDNKWTPTNKQTKFYIHHAVVPHMGGHENDHGDFNEYSVQGTNQFDEQYFLNQLSEIFNHILQAQSNDNIEHAFWPSLDMDSFLSNLSNLDAVYKDPQFLSNLKKQIAERFFKEVAKFPKLKVHLCLSTGSPEEDMGFNAIVGALALSPDTVKQAVDIYTNVDAAYTAQEMATRLGKPFQVSVTNFTKGDLDENSFEILELGLFSRSPLAYSFLKIINNKGPQLLSARVEELGGKCVTPPVEQPKVDQAYPKLDRVNPGYAPYVPMDAPPAIDATQAQINADANHFLHGNHEVNNRIFDNSNMNTVD